MTDWLVWCSQTATCLWWPFSTYREFMLYIVAPLALVGLAARWWGKWSNER